MPCNSLAWVHSCFTNASVIFRSAFVCLLAKPNGRHNVEMSSSSASKNASGVGQNSINFGNTPSTCFRDVQFNIIHETKISQASGQRSSWIKPIGERGGITLPWFCERPPRRRASTGCPLRKVRFFSNVVTTIR